MSEPVKILSQPTAGDLSIKRCYLPGAVMESACPRCGEKVERHFDSDYLSYPRFGESFTETMSHDVECECEDEHGDDCTYECHEWEVTLKLVVTLEAP